MSLCCFCGPHSSEAHLWRGVAATYAYASAGRLDRGERAGAWGLVHQSDFESLLTFPLLKQRSRNSSPLVSNFRASPLISRVRKIPRNSRRVSRKSSLALHGALWHIALLLSHSCVPLQSPEAGNPENVIFETKKWTLGGLFWTHFITFWGYLMSPLTRFTKGSEN